MTVSNLFYIGHRYTNSKMIIKNSSILTLFEDIAGMHSNAAGEDYRISNSRWLLTSYKIKILQKPQYGDEVDIITWATETKNITASREFEVRDKNGQLLICALSNWVHYNIVEKKFDKVSDALIAAYTSHPEKTNFGEFRLRKLSEPATYYYNVEKQINPAWIDVNMHLNNSHYLDLANEIVPAEIDLEQDIDGIDIMYKHEIPAGATVSCFYAETEKEYIVTYKSTDLSVTHGIIIFHKTNDVI